MLRLFVAGARAEGEPVRITGAALRHLRVHRLAAGDRLVVFDDHGGEHEIRLARVGVHLAEGTVLATRWPARESPLDLVLAPGLLKGPKMDLVVEKATELGVGRIAPLACRRAVGRGARLERWRRLAVAAAEQSGRTRVPVVDPPRPLEEVVAAPWPGLRLLAWEEERETALASLPSAAGAVVVLVGPEGGFTEDEVECARAHGFTTVALAPRILRAETAAVVAAALCQERWGDLSTPGGLR